MVLCVNKRGMCLHSLMFFNYCFTTLRNIAASSSSRLYKDKGYIVIAYIVVVRINIIMHGSLIFSLTAEESDLEKLWSSQTHTWLKLVCCKGRHECSFLKTINSIGCIWVKLKDRKWRDAWKWVEMCKWVITANSDTVAILESRILWICFELTKCLELE